MPRLNDTPEEATLRSRLREWLAAHAPATKDVDWPARVTWQRTLYEAGWLGLSWPADYGGQGASLREQFVYNEELVRAHTPDLPNGIGLMIVGPAMIAVGSDNQKRRYLPKILSADEIWCQGFSEPNAGSDLANLRTRAVADGDDYIVTGQKIWSSYSLKADLCFLLARTNPDAPRHKGISCLIVDLKSPGVEVKPLRQITGDAEFGEIFLDGVRVPKANLVGSENDGWMVAMTTFTRERANIAISLSVRLNQQFDELLAQVREAGADADLRRRVAQTYVDGRCLDWTCRRFGEELYGFHSSLIKVAWAETNQAMQELGLGLRGTEVPVAETEQGWQFGYLRSRGNSIEGGTSEILRTIIAERILGLPRLGK
jgi:alkylation response protein AidB-like acyl-CoA dehydrogenase